MNIEKWIIAHFSPTGGTRKVADAIAAGFQTPVVEMDLTKADSAVTLGENDALMAVLPVFAGRVPQISLERLSALKGSGQKAVAVVVYGNREYDDALLETRDALEANGFRVIMVRKASGRARHALGQASTQRIQLMHTSLRVWLGSSRGMAPTGHCRAQTPHRMQLSFAAGWNAEGFNAL